MRYRPNVVTTTGGHVTPATPKGYYDLQIDYYIEFWNMTDRDIYASPQVPPTNKIYPDLSGAPNLSGATVFVRDQQQWTGYPPGDLLAKAPTHVYGTTEEYLHNNTNYQDWQIDLTNNVYDGNSALQDGTGGKPLGVVFRAGQVTVITTDPDTKVPPIPVQGAYTFKSLSGLTNNPGVPGGGIVANPSNVYFCPLKQGQRDFVGNILNSSGTGVDSADGLALGGQFGGSNYSRHGNQSGE